MRVLYQLRGRYHTAQEKIVTDTWRPMWSNQGCREHLSADNRPKQGLFGGWSYLRHKKDRLYLIEILRHKGAWAVKIKQTYKTQRNPCILCMCRGVSQLCLILSRLLYLCGVGRGHFVVSGFRNCWVTRNDNSQSTRTVISINIQIALQGKRNMQPGQAKHMGAACFV